MRGKHYAVIGLGRFSSSIATTLYKEGNEVLAININETELEEKDQVNHTVTTDSIMKKL